jgi:hypothetical protein
MPPTPDTIQRLYDMTLIEVLSVLERTKFPAEEREQFSKAFASEFNKVVAAATLKALSEDDQRKFFEALSAGEEPFKTFMTEHFDALAPHLEEAIKRFKETFMFGYLKQIEQQNQ